MSRVAILAGSYRNFGQLATTVSFVVVLAGTHVAHDGLIFLHATPPVLLVWTKRPR